MVGAIVAQLLSSDLDVKVSVEPFFIFYFGFFHPGRPAVFLVIFFNSYV